MRDRYGRHVASEAYRRDRVAKAGIIEHLCREQLASAASIGDLGAGTGIIKKTLETNFNKSIIGFEIDAPFIVERTRMVRADVLRLPVRPESFDFLLLNHLYEHVDDQEGLFREAYRSLSAGGQAYVSAGNRLTVIEPHYRLPFLSWLPARAASLYLRVTRRGESYAGIRFRTYRSLVRLMGRAGFTIHDITDRAIDDLISRAWGPGWGRAWAAARWLPDGVRRSLLRAFSPQWFFTLRKPAAMSDGSAPRESRA